MGVEVAIAAISAAVALGTGIYSATNKPEAPKEPKPGVSPVALGHQRQLRAAASGREGTIKTSQKLGQVGGS